MSAFSQRIALLEFGSSHIECLYSQLAFLKHHHCEVHIIARERAKTRLSYFDLGATHHWLPDHSNTTNHFKLAKQISAYLRDNGIDTLLINTYSGSLLKWLLPRLSGMNIISIVHDLRKFSKSIFRKYLAMNARRFWVLNDHLLHFAPRHWGLQFNAFYPIFFPAYPATSIPKPADEFWIGIPGQVEFKRKNFETLLSAELSRLHPSIKFVLLGPAMHAYGDGQEIQKTFQKHGAKRFLMFEDFLHDRLFHHYIQNCDLLMPLVGGRNRYLYNAVSGTFNLSFGYRIPMLVSRDATRIYDLAEYGIPFEAGKLVPSLHELFDNRELIKRAANKMKNAVKFSFDFQQRRYMDHVLLRHEAHTQTSATWPIRCRKFGKDEMNQAQKCLTTMSLFHVDPLSPGAYEDIRNLISSDPHLRQQVQEKLLKAGRGSIPLLERALTVVEPAIRWEAVKLLVAMEDIAVFPLLLKSLADPIDSIAWLAAEGIIRFEDAGEIALQNWLNAQTDTAISQRILDHIFHPAEKRSGQKNSNTEGKS